MVKCRIYLFNAVNCILKSQHLTEQIKPVANSIFKGIKWQVAGIRSCNKYGRLSAVGSENLLDL
jgi:hypothetical protein